jgi:hypothetical protein
VVKMGGLYFSLITLSLLFVQLPFCYSNENTSTEDVSQSDTTQKSKSSAVKGFRRHSAGSLSITLPDTWVDETEYHFASSDGDARLDISRLHVASNLNLHRMMSEKINQQQDIFAASLLKRESLILNGHEAEASILKIPPDDAEAVELRILLIKTDLNTVISATFAGSAHSLSKLWASFITEVHFTR